MKFAKYILPLLLMPPLIAFGQWMPKGDAFLGENSDQLGNDVAISADGNVIAIGSPSDGQVLYQEEGTVQVYEWDGASWNTKGQMLIGDNPGDYFGFSVSLSADGNTLGVGARQHDYPYGSAGQVKIFDWDGTNWVQKGTDLYGDNDGNQFGYVVELSADGNVLAVGAPESQGLTFKGEVNVFYWTGFDWYAKGLDIEGETTSDELGYDLDLSDDGNRIIVGAPYNSDSGTFCGYAKVYEWTNNHWNQIGDKFYGTDSENAGRAVSISGDGTTIAVGYPQSSIGGNNTGNLRLFRFISNSWIQVGQDIMGEMPYDGKGWACDLNKDGNIVAVSSKGASGTYSDCGAIRVYNWNSAEWIQLMDPVYGAGADFELGTSVAINDDGDVFIGSTETNGASEGYAVVYEGDIGIGFEELTNKEELVVYPNPTSEFIHIKPAPIVGERFKIYDLLGNVVLEGIISSSPISTTELSEGTYILTFNTPNKDKLRFVKI